MSRKFVEIAINVAFWLLSGWVIAASFSITAQEFEVIDGNETLRIVRNDWLLRQLLVCIAWAFGLFYTNLWLALRAASADRRRFFGLWSPALLLGVGAVYHGIQAAGVGPEGGRLAPSLSIGILVFYYAVSTAYGIGKIWLQTERHRQALLLDKQRAELTLLRNQLHPHFLFNVLNNLLSMVDQRRDPHLATALDKLSGLLRYVVYETAEDQVPLRREIAFLENFAELQQLRFAPGEVDFSLTVAGPHDEQRVEPGIFIPFVENAFKYGTVPEAFSRIEVEFDLSDPDRVSFSVRNPLRVGASSAPSPGTGLRATRERLALVYPGRHELRITQKGTFFVQLTLRTDANRDH